MSFPAPFPYSICLKCGPRMKQCMKHTKGACQYPKMYFSTKRSYEAEKSKWTEKKEKQQCDFFPESDKVWDCFEDDWMD